jgi:DNA-binding transcriptional ArsR family regulator
VNNSLPKGFAALAHPVRLAIVERLAQGPATVAEASRGTGVSKPAITKHLRALEEAGLVVRVIDGRQHRLSLVPAALESQFAWIERQRALWERKFAAIDDHLRRKDETP